MTADAPARTGQWDGAMEVRRKVGLPAVVAQRAGLVPGDPVHVQVRPDRRIVITPVATLLEKYVGAVPGLRANDGRE